MKIATIVVSVLCIGSIVAWRVVASMRQGPPALPARELRTLDEEGHLFPRNVAISVCTDTAAKLSRPPYAGHFTVLEPSGKERELITAGAVCCAPDTKEPCC